jgi:hypothetical protein
MSQPKGRDLSALIKKKEERMKANDSSLQGEITSVIYRNGPIIDRKSTDTEYAIPFLLLFIFAVYLFIVCLSDGDIKRLFVGYDKNGS